MHFFSLIEDIDICLLEEIIESNGFIKAVTKVVHPIRKSMKSVANQFNGKFDGDSQQNSIPAELPTLVSLLIGRTSNMKGINQAI